MPSAVSEKEIEVIRKSLINLKWTNVLNCTFRRSGTGNIVGSDISGKVVFIIRKDGLLVDPQGRGPVNGPKIRIKNFEQIRLEGIKKATENKNAVIAETSQIPGCMPQPAKHLTARSVASSIQGELNALELTAFNSITDKFSVKSEGQYTLVITPMSNSRYTMFVNPVRYEIEADATMSGILSDIKEKLHSEIYDVYLSEYAKTNIVKELVKNYKMNGDYFIPEAFIDYTEAPRFYTWVMNNCHEPLPNYGKMDRDGIITISHIGQDMRYNTKNETLSLVSRQTLLKTAAFARRNRKKIQRCLKQVSECEDFSFKINSTAINGYYVIDRKKYFFHQDENNLSAKKLKKEISEIKKENKKRESRIFKEIIGKIKSSSLYGDAVATAVVDCIVQNNGMITKHMVIDHLRGLSKDTKLDVKESYYKGAFSLLTPEYISDKIETLIAEGFIISNPGKSLERRSCYLRPVPYLEEFIKYSGTFGKKSFKEYSDFDWLIYLRKHIEAESEGTMEKEMEVLEHPAVFCLDPGLVGKFISNRPEYWMDYIEMMRFAEKGIKKKYWKAVKEASQKLQDLP